MNQSQGSSSESPNQFRVSESGNYSPTGLKSPTSSSEGNVFFSSKKSTFADNRRLISKSQMKGECKQLDKQETFNKIC